MLIKNDSALDAYMDKGNDSPIKRYLRGDDNNPEVTINVHYSASAGSDPAVMKEIGERIYRGTPIALRNANEICVFVPSSLTAYMFGSKRSFFTYKSRKDFIERIKLQYLTHKELLSTEMLLDISTTILWMEEK